jgi:hypothetical protein
MPVTVNVGDVSDLAFADALDHLLKPGRVTILMPHLEMFAAAAHRVDNPFAVLDGEAHRFFAIDVPAALQRGDDVFGVKTERRSDDHGINVARLQEATMIAIDGRIFACNLSRGGEAWFVNVAESGKAHAGYPQEISHQFLSPAAGANNAEADLIRWGDQAHLSNATTDNRRA